MTDELFNIEKLPGGNPYSARARDDRKRKSHRAKIWARRQLAIF